MKPKGGTLVAPGKASRPHPVRGVDFIFRGVDSIFRGVDYLPYIGGLTFARPRQRSSADLQSAESAADLSEVSIGCETEVG